MAEELPREPKNAGSRDADDEQPAKSEGRAPSPSSPSASETDEAASNRKERVLHTRVPAVLERELKRFAENLRVPVSNLVRTILEDALDVADAATENVETRLKNAAHQLEVERERLKKRVLPDPLADVFAFQQVTIAQASQCVKCGRDLEAGAKAHLGLTDGPQRPGSRRIFACESCIPK